MSIRSLKPFVSLIILTQIFFLASISFAQNDDEKLEQAKLAFEEAKVLFEKGTLESFQAAEIKFRTATKLYAELGDEENEAYAISGLGVVLNILGKREEAIALMEKALPIAYKLEDFQGAAYLLNLLGTANLELGNNTEALRQFNEGLKLVRDSEDKEGEVVLINSIGQFYLLEGENEKALEFFNQALVLAKEIEDKAGEGSILNNIAMVKLAVGKYQEALEYLNQSLPISVATQNKLAEGKIRNNIGFAYFQLGESLRALKYFNQSLEIVRLTGDKTQEATTLGNMGSVFFDLENYEEALKYYTEGLNIGREIKNPRIEGKALNNIGLLYSYIDEYQQALEYYELALDFSRNSNDKFQEAITLANIGEAQSSLGNNKQAIKTLNQALSMLTRLENKDGEAIAFSNLMYVWNTEKNFALAIIYGKQSINKFQEIRANIQTLEKETQIAFLKKYEDAYRYLADVLITQGRFAEAEKVLAMLKEEEFFDFVRRDVGEVKTLDERVPLNDKEKKLIDRYSQLAENIVEIGEEFSKLQDKKAKLSQTNENLSPEEQKRFEELEKLLDDANAAFQLFLEKELVAELGKEKSKEIEVDRNLQEKLKKWGDGTVALYTVVGEDRYRVILTTSKVQIDGKTEIKIADLNAKVFAFRRALQNPNYDPRPLGKELYDILIKPVEKELKQANAKTLVWSLDGTLRYIPLAALSPDGQKYLVENYQNVIITPKTRDDLTDSNKHWQALGLGVSEGNTVSSPEDNTRKIEFNPLPGTQRELLSIVKDEKSKGEKGVLNGRRLMNKDFTLANFKDSLIKQNTDGTRKYNVIHIASHFSLGTNWSNSFLLLGNGEILTLEEINKSSSISFGDVELITLSACNTGFGGGEDTNGKEVDSLASVIQTKSGKAVLATLWAVADESTSLLISEFYRLRKANPKLTKSEAMQKAQQAMLSGKLKAINKDKNRAEVFGKEDENLDLPPFEEDEKRPFAHPYYWSPFVLYGNWK